MRRKFSKPFSVLSCKSRIVFVIKCYFNFLSGLIKASGDIEEKEKSDEPFVKMITIQPNNYITTASSYPQIFIYGSVLYVVIILIAGIKKNGLIKFSKGI